MDKGGIKMHIRKAQNEDIKQIERLLFQVNLIHHYGRPDLFKYGATKYNVEQLKNILADENTPVFVAVNSNNEVIAYAFCIIKQVINDNILKEVKTLYIDDLCVDENYRKKHIGTTLFEYVLNFAKEINCYNVTLNVWNLNQDALAFYQHLDMKPLKIQMEKRIN